MFCVRLRNLPKKLRSEDFKKLFDRPVDSIEREADTARLCFKGSDVDAVKFHETWNGKAIGNTRLEMMADW